jgi:hypothetical protein
MPRRLLIDFTLACALAAINSTSWAAITVSQPTASTSVEAGDDYAAQVLGNAWDMSDAIDVDTQESLAYFTGLNFGSGNLSGTTSIAGAGLFPLYMGLGSTINLSRGANFPIDTTHYRYLTVKLRDNAASQNVNAYFYPTDISAYGVTHYFPVPQNQFAIVTIDFINDLYPSPTSIVQWTDQTSVRGLRLDPANGSSIGFNIDWIRLTAPATAAQKTSVQWTDSGSASTYSIIAVDTAGTGTSYTLASGVSGTSFLANTSFLAPGQYQIQVKRTDNTATGSSATFRISSPPQIAMTAPSANGDLAKDFATAIVGNPWGPFSAADFQTVSNFTNVSYTNPVGSFYGRPTNSDPSWYFNLGGHTIDTSIYRSFCFNLEVFGPRSVGLGSVARVFWGNSPASMTTSQDIVLDDNQSDTLVSQYCIPDLGAVPLEASPNGGPWSGTKSQFRIDPDEFTPPGGCSTPDTCHDVRLDKVTLSPFAQANPGYTFQWTLADADNASDTVAIYLDPDTSPLNGNEMLIHSATTATGSGSYAWPGSTSVTYGTYNVLVVADDGINSVSQYAGGPLIVGARDGIFRNGFGVP